jgi:ABC-2 type transport system permease protein
MSVAVPATGPIAARRSSGVVAAYRVELAKIGAQLLPRLVALVCLVAPWAFAVFINSQSTVPTDSLFGRWVHTSGFSIPFVILQFAATAGFPLIASVVAGDIFASEDRQGTWKTVLTRSCSRRSIFWGKTLAAFTYATAMVAVLAVSSLVAGVVIVGHQQVISLSGAPVGAGRAAVLVLESFAIALLPTLAFTCLAILFSVISRNSLVGIVGPLAIWLVMVLISLVGSGVVVRSMLPVNAVETWHGLQIPGSSSTSLWLGVIVSVAYGVLCLDAARRSFARRDFAGDGQTPLNSAGLRRGAISVAAIAAILAVGMILDSTWITSKHVETSVAATFRNLVVEQQGLLGRKLEASDVRIYPFCSRESAVSGSSTGAGDDWTCTLYVNAPNLNSTARYSVSVRPNGCYAADGPPEMFGPLHLRTPDGGTALNPLLGFDGCMIAP